MTTGQPGEGNSSDRRLKLTMRRIFLGGCLICVVPTLVHIVDWRTSSILNYSLETESLAAITLKQFSCLGVPQCWGYRCHTSMRNLLCESWGLEIRSSFLHRKQSYPLATSSDPRERLYVSIYIDQVRNAERKTSFTECSGAHPQFQH